LRNEGTENWNSIFGRRSTFFCEPKLPEGLLGPPCLTHHWSRGLSIESQGDLRVTTQLPTYRCVELYLHSPPFHGLVQKGKSFITVLTKVSYWNTSRTILIIMCTKSLLLILQISFSTVFTKA
jgi:hypothetical protein